jgi:hypothetical protein
MSEMYFQQLSQAAPGARLLHLIAWYWISAAIGVAAELGIANLLADGPHASTDLATATGSHPSTLYRLLRTLASVGLFSEVEPGGFALTEMGAFLRTDHPQSLHGLTRYACGDRQWRLFGDLRYSVDTGQPAQYHVFGVSGTEYWVQRPEERAIFDAAMRSMTAQVMGAVVRAYDFSQFRTVVDGGGGHGALLTAILGVTPGLRGILLDHPYVAEGAKPHVAAAGVLDRCEVVGGDMFTEVPGGGDAYVFSRVIHDWDDARGSGVGQLPPRHGPGRAAVVDRGGDPAGGRPRLRQAERSQHAGRSRRAGAHGGGVSHAVRRDRLRADAGHPDTVPHEHHRRHAASRGRSIKRSRLSRMIPLRSWEVWSMPDRRRPRGSTTMAANDSTSTDNIMQAVAQYVMFFSQDVEGSPYALLMLTPPSTAQVCPVT